MRGALGLVVGFNFSGDRCRVKDNSEGDESMRVHVLKTVIVAGLFFVVSAMMMPFTSHAGPTCTCLYDGKRFELASCACMKTPNGPHIACCGQVLNNSSWTITNRSCPVASAVDHVPVSSTQDYLAALDGNVVKQSLWGSAAKAE
jgi:hypothetical protein